MTYFDENGNQIESYDLKLGYLVDYEWIDHPAVAQSGHYEYNGVTQTFVVDVPAAPAWREVTAQKYVLYTEAELAHMAKLDYATRIDNLEVADSGQATEIDILKAVLMAIEEGVANA